MHFALRTINGRQVKILVGVHRGTIGNKGQEADCKLILQRGGDLVLNIKKIFQVCIHCNILHTSEQKPRP